MNHRQCGDCTLCCRLVPVEGLRKAAGERCRYQTRRGCSVYASLDQVSPECSLWSCRWLVDPDATGLRRPDRVHYVVDIMPDFIGAADPDGKTTDVPVMQVWADPAFPDAWRDPALRGYIERMAAERGEATLIRFGSATAIAVFPPSMSADGEWTERAPRMAKPGGWINPLDALRERAGLKRREDGRFDLDPARLAVARLIAAADRPPR